MVVVPLAEGGEEPGDVGLRDLAQPTDPAGREVLGVAAQVTAVGGDRVRRQTALDGQVVQVAGDDPLDGGSGAERGGQSRTSSRATAVMPCASATSGSTTCPATTLTPCASARLLATAAEVPSFASAIT
jgi:hypothetical protein